MGPEFSQDEQELRDNYVALHESTGFSYDDIASRLEENVNDHTTAAKVRALAAGDEPVKRRRAKPQGRTAPVKSTAAPAKGTARTSPPSPVGSDGIPVLTDNKKAAKPAPAKAAPAKKAPAKPAGKKD